MSCVKKSSKRERREYMGARRSGSDPSTLAAFARPRPSSASGVHAPNVCGRLALGAVTIEPARDPLTMPPPSAKKRRCSALSSAGAAKRTLSNSAPRDSASNDDDDDMDDDELCGCGTGSTSGTQPTSGHRFEIDGQHVNGTSNDPVALIGCRVMLTFTEWSGSFGCKVEAFAPDAPDGPAYIISWEARTSKWDAGRCLYSQRTPIREPSCL
jgi:hypothetical protein